MNKLKIDQHIRNDLFSVQTEKVIAAIKILNVKGHKGYLPILFDLLLSEPEEEIIQAIQKLLGTIKDKETVPVFVETITNPNYKNIQKQLLIACWQNGLDFADYIDVFVDVIINNDWEIAFEAFTVIENLEYFPDKELLEPIKIKIKKALGSAKEQNRYFLEEIIRLMP